MAGKFVVLAFAFRLLACEGGSGVVLRGIRKHRHQHSASSSSWGAYFQANNEDFNFWSEEWAETKTQLIRLALLNGKSPVKRTGSAAKSAEAQAEEHLRTANATVKSMMLDNSVQYAQSRIDRLKKQEEKSAKRYAEQEKGHNQRQGVIDAKFHNKTLIAQFYQSDTSEENRQWGSWQRQRARQKDQFQVSSKIQGGAIEQARALASAYRKESDARALAKVQETFANFCHSSWGDMMKEREALENASPSVHV
mmetsp:Transcript_113837/g.179157  ORF Transcript_113837/g.179157 Transcript_113837/m.179157 type:complete len:252 (-) Transcript_113837:65-820(-)